MQALKPFTPTMVGGAADLVESTKTEFEGAGVFSATHAGRNIAFGIREHAMGSIVNGIALDAGDAEAVRLDVPDLLRLHAARRAALRADAAAVDVGLDARLGRRRRGRPDPPAGRAPHGAARDPEPLVRAARRRERDGAWPGGSRSSATAARSRSPCRARRCRRSTARGRAREGALRGAYTLWQSGDGRARPDPDRHRLRGRHSRSTRPRSACDANVRVVSMPCWELFEEQPADYREEVLPPAVRARALGRGRRSRSAGSAGSATAGDRSRSTATARRRPATRCWSGSGSRSRTSPRARRRCSSGWHEGRRRLRPPRREAARARARRRWRRSGTRSSTSAPTPTRCASTTRTRRASSARRSSRGDAERGVLVCGSGVGASIAA